MTNTEINLAHLKAVIILYILVSFITLDFNPLNWDKIDRYFLVFMYVFFEINMSYWLNKSQINK